MSILCKIGIHKWDKSYKSFITTKKCRCCRVRMQQEYYEFGISSEWVKLDVDMEDRRELLINEIIK